MRGTPTSLKQPVSKPKPEQLMSFQGKGTLAFKKNIYTPKHINPADKKSSSSPNLTRAQVPGNTMKFDDDQHIYDIVENSQFNKEVSGTLAAAGKNNKTLAPTKQIVNYQNSMLLRKPLLHGMPISLSSPSSPRSLQCKSLSPSSSQHPPSPRMKAQLTRSKTQDLLSSEESKRIVAPAPLVHTDLCQLQPSRNAIKGEPALSAVTKTKPRNIALAGSFKYM